MKRQIKIATFKGLETMVMMTIMDSRCAYDFAVKEVREAGSSFICGNDFVCAKVGSEDGKFKQDIT